MKQTTREEAATMPATQAQMRLNNPGLPIRRFRKRVGRCYELAYAYIRDSDDASDWMIIHGETAQIPTGHAWLRRGETVYDPVLDQYLSVDEYKATEHARYPKKEAIRLGIAQGHYGPWHWGIWLPIGEGEAWLQADGASRPDDPLGLFPKGDRPGLEL
jgi:hypothetical protein